MFPEPLKEAVGLIDSGKLERAKIILEQWLEENPQDEHAWLWLADCENEPRRKRYCYQRALRANPDSLLGRQKLAELRSAVDAPSLDEVLSIPDGTLEPTFESAQQARRILAGSRNEPGGLPGGRPAQGAGTDMEKALRCPSCHAGYLHEHVIIHHGSWPRTLAASLAAGLAALFTAILVLILHEGAGGVLFSLNNWFYNHTLQPFGIFLGASAAAFILFSLYFNRRQRVLRCSACLKEYRHGKKKPVPLAGNRS